MEKCSFLYMALRNPVTKRCSVGDQISSR